MPKNIGLYNTDLSVPRKEDVDGALTQAIQNTTQQISTHNTSSDPHANMGWATGSDVTQAISTHNTSGNAHANMGWVDNTTLQNAIASKADKAVPSAAGNVALLNSSGNLQDSGKSIDDIGAQSTVQTVTLTTSGWTQGSDSRYYQTVSVPGMTADAAVVTVDIAITTQDTDAMVEIMSAWSTLAVSNGVQGNGSLTIYGFGLPTVNIPINVGVS